ncbi:MAG: hypothetical protein ACK2U2_15705, partial [Anaerolineae bacterium]
PSPGVALQGHAGLAWPILFPGIRPAARYEFERVLSEKYRFISLAAEQSTPWVDEQLFLLLDLRYRLASPTVIITNEELKNLPARLYSRLCDQALSIVAYNPAPDHRLGTGLITC